MHIILVQPIHIITLAYIHILKVYDKVLSQDNFCIDAQDSRFPK